MADAMLYKTTPDVYQRYIKHTTQKQVLVRKIQEALLERFDFASKKEFTFVDVGAGEGLVTIPIIQFLESKITTYAYAIEPSPMIENFKAHSFDHCTLIQKPIEEVLIPEADFILCSHVIPYLQEPQKVIQLMVNALKKEGVGLIVVTNEQSDDSLLKRELLDLSDVGMSVNVITECLQGLQIRFSVETVGSTINVNGCFDGTEDGQAIFSFMFKRPMSALSPEELGRFLVVMKERANPSGILTKREDYIWFY